MAACFCQGRVPGCAPGGAVTCLLRRQGPVTKEKATPLSVSPSLRYGATCGARFRRGPRKLAWRLKQRAALIRLKLCSSARPEGKGSRAALRAIAALGLSVGSTRGAGSGPDSAERRHWGRSATVGSRFSRSETRAQTPIPEWWAQRGFFANLCLRHCIAVEMMSGCCWPGAAGGRMEELSFNV